MAHDIATEILKLATEKQDAQVEEASRNSHVQIEIALRTRAEMGGPDVQGVIMHECTPLKLHLWRDPVDQSVLLKQAGITVALGDGPDKMPDGEAAALFASALKGIEDTAWEHFEPIEDGMVLSLIKLNWRSVGKGSERRLRPGQVLLQHKVDEWDTVRAQEVLSGYLKYYRAMRF